MGQDEAPFSRLGQWMAVLFVGLGSAAARAGDAVGCGHVELNTQIRLDTLHREASAGARTVSEAAGQATRAVLELHVPPQAWTKNTDTLRSPLACKSPALLANLGPLHCPHPPTPSNHAPTRVRRLLSLHLYPHAPLETGPLRAPLPTPPPPLTPPFPPTARARVTVPGLSRVRELGGWVAARASGSFSRNFWAPRPQPGGAGMDGVTSAPWRDVPDTCTLAWGGMCAGRPPL